MTPREALAQHLGFDLSEMKDYRYHYGHTNLPIYSIGDNYFCCVKIGKSPAIHYDIDFKWSKVDDQFVQKNGFQIYIHKP